MIRSPAETRDRWLNYGRRYAVHPTLHDGSVACMLGPLAPEGGTLQDYSGRTAGAAWSVGAGDMPKYVQGNVRGQSFWAGQYDGSNDYANAGNITHSAATVALSAWIYPTSLAAGGLQIVTAKFATGATDSSFYLAIYDDDSDGAYQGRVFSCSPSGGSPSITRQGTIAIPLATWTHLFALISPPTVSLWVNGIADGSATNALSTEIRISTTPLMTGARNAASASAFFAGNIAGSVAWNRVLTQSEIAILATHPLAAFEVRVPKYLRFAPTGVATHLWPWQIRRSRRMRGHR